MTPLWRVDDSTRRVWSVGKGFKHDVARSLKKMRDKIKTRVPNDRVPGANLVTTGPAYVAEIEPWLDQ